jgi:hypothetical protein
MARNVTAVRSQVESALAGRIASPFTSGVPSPVETAPLGVPQADDLIGGLPRGGITEICGPRCSGRTSLLFSALASRTAQKEACAVIDGRDAFDPYSAEQNGVRLEQLLWVRCQNIDQSLRAADLILHGGGFGLVVLDLGDIPSAVVRYISLNVWFRFRRAVEHTPTIFLILEQEPHAKTCASLVLQMETEEVRWTGLTREHRACPSHARLYSGSRLRTEIVRSRAQPEIGRRPQRIAQAVTLEATYATRESGKCG